MLSTNKRKHDINTACTAVELGQIVVEGTGKKVENYPHQYFACLKNIEK